MITLFGELQKEEMEKLKASKPSRYEGIMAERKRAAEQERRHSFTDQTYEFR